MHILHLCDGSVAGDYFRNIATGLSASGIRLTLAELGSGSRPEWLDELPSVDYFALGASSKAAYPAAVRSLAREVSRRKVDIVQTHLFYSGLLGVLASKLFSMPPVAVMRHHTAVVRMLGTWAHVAADRWTARNATHVLTVSEAARRYMNAVDGIHRPDIEVLHLGFDLEKFKPSAALRSRIRREFGFRDDEIVVGYVANLVPGKGHRELMAAFEEIAAEAPNARLLLIGRGEMEAVSQAAAARPGSYTIAGWRADIDACLNAMDIFVQPSLTEAFSQVIVEAMGVGLPIVATDVGGAREALEDKISGLIVAPGDSQALAAAICRLAADPDLRAGLGAKARARALESFSSDRMVARHIELYEKWLQDR